MVAIIRARGPRFLRGVVALALLCGALVVDVATGASADAQDDPSIATLVDTELVAALDAVGLGEQWESVGTVDPRTGLVAVKGGDIEALRNDLLARATKLAEVRLEGRRLEALDAELLDLDAQLAVAQQRLEAELVVAELALSVIDDALGDAAVAQYVRGRAVPPSGEDLQAMYDDATRATLVNVAVEELMARHQAQVDDVTEREAEIAEIVGARAANEETRVDVQADLFALRPIWDGLEADVPVLLDQLLQRRLGGVVDGLGLPLVVFDAYLTGESWTASAYPECGIRWQAIAAIGRVESNHAGGNGDRVLANGQLSAPFYGVLLDGSVEGTATVTDTDGGALDGNAQFDRAVGPFQFLPGSWRASGVDGNGDGVIDVNSMYDGAATVGSYLCSRVSPLTDDGALRQAFLTYNYSSVYAEEVSRWMLTYDDFEVAELGDATDG